MDDRASYAGVVTVVTTVKNGLEVDHASLTDWLFGLFIAGNRSDGFWSGEILPPGRSQNSDWSAVHRFHSAEQATNWQQSTSRQEFLTQFKNIAGASQAVIVDEISKDGSIGSAVTAIVTDLKPEMEEEYWAWEYRIQSIQAKFPGFGGVYVQPPPPGKPRQWTTLLRFDSPSALENWFNAPVRQQLLAESDKFISALRYHKIESLFPGWFPSEEKDGTHTPRWKAATMVLVGLFPILELIKVFYAPLTTGLTPIVAMTISTVLSVSLVSFVSMPILVKLFDWWLAPEAANATAKTELLGLLIALAVFAAEIVLGWHIS